MMRRREFIALIGGAATWPLAARAQQGKGPVRLGFLPLGSPSNAYDRSLVEAFKQGLRRVGLIENRDVILDVVWISGDPDQAVRDVLGRGAELLIPCGSSASVAAKRQTSTIPIVFVSVGDPIAMGLVESLPRPGRNATGFGDILADLSGRQSPRRYAPGRDPPGSPSCAMPAAAPQDGRAARNALSGQPANRI
jgi:putative ABC transport system substrate-binding protein